MSFVGAASIISPGGSLLKGAGLLKRAITADPAAGSEAPPGQQSAARVAVVTAEAKLEEARDGYSRVRSLIAARRGT